MGRSKIREWSWKVCGGSKVRFGLGLVVFATQIRKVFSTDFSARCIVMVCGSTITTTKEPIATGASLCVWWVSVVSTKTISPGAHFWLYGGVKNRSIAYIELELGKISAQQYSSILPVDVFTAGTNVMRNGYAWRLSEPPEPILMKNVPRRGWGEQIYPYYAAGYRTRT